MPERSDAASWKAAGFEGMESTDRGGHARKGRRGPRNWPRGWACGSTACCSAGPTSTSPAAVERDLAAVETALRAGPGLRGRTVLLVPCRIGGMPMPEAWEFDIRFDEKTGHLKQVVAGDNAKYARYIEAHNQATDASREAVKKLIPDGREDGRDHRPGERLEQPVGEARAVRATSSPRSTAPGCRAYFDIGNHVKYAPPQEWIRTLGKLIVKCHVKDFKLNARRPRRHVRRHPRGQRQLAGGPQGPGRRRLQRLDDDRGQRASRRWTSRAAGSI